MPHALHWAGASANVDWATKSLLQHEAVELFGAVGNGGVGEIAPQ